MRAVSTTPELNTAWRELEAVLEIWRDEYDGGEVNSEYIDDTLGVLLSSKAAESIFHVSKMDPLPHTRRCIILAREVWSRVLAAIERATIVSQISIARRRECKSPATSPRLRPNGMQGGALSPTSKCK